MNFNQFRDRQKVDTTKYILYRLDGTKPIRGVESRIEVEFETWTPSIFHWKPRGLPLSLCTWWCYYATKIILHRPAYVIFLLPVNQRIIHYTLVSSKSFKFPFMKDDDIQIGPSWTAEEYRNQGIASVAILATIGQGRRDAGNYYWIVREENIVSRRLVEKLAFEVCGEIKRRKKLGVFPVFEP